MGTPIRVAVVAEQDTSMIEALSSSPVEMALTGPFSDPDQLIHVQHDVCIVDMDLFKGSGIEAIHRMSQCSPYARIITVFSSPGDIETRLLIANGVTGIILRDEIAKGLDYMVRTAATGGFVMSRKVLRQFIPLAQNIQ